MTKIRYLLGVLVGAVSGGVIGSIAGGLTAWVVAGTFTSLVFIGAWHFFETRRDL